MKITDITAGMHIGKFYVIEEDIGSYRLNVAPIESKEKNIQRIPYFKCQCECGRICSVRGDLLASGLRTSCGCQTLKDDKDDIIQLFLEHNVNFREDYKLSPTIREFHFAIFDNEEILLGVIDLQSPAYSNRIGNEQKDRVRKRRNILLNKQEYCEFNDLPYLILPTTPIFNESSIVLPQNWQHIDNYTWEELKNRINTAFGINESETQWYD